ncbi:MAG: pfs [Devosia sp.]|nr:pfs [Devosia sp.]
MPPILYVMAVTVEFGPYLRARIDPVMTGVGPVEAAISLSVALAEHAARGALPALVVSLGSAGSRSLEQTGIYQASSVTYRDMDATALGFAPGVTPFLDLPAVLTLGPALSGVRQASLATGASVVSGSAYDAIEADMVDMETYALLRACQRFGVPLVAIRGISDGASELGRLEDWAQYLHIIDERLAATVDRIEAAFRDGELDLSGRH